MNEDAPAMTASTLYNMIHCPHRVVLDAFGDQSERDPVSSFVEMLWDHGLAHEQKTVQDLDVLDLSSYAGAEKERATIAAMEQGAPLIYSGRLSTDDLIGQPDLLRREEGGYVAGDIKAGSGEHGDDDNGSKLKKHYGVQLALYTDILERIGRSAHRRPFVLDIHGEEVPYDMDERQGQRNPWTMWELYQQTLAQARSILAKEKGTTPAYSSICKICHWYSACLRNMETADDLTLIPGLGRSKRDAMVGTFPSIEDLARADVELGTKFPGVGEGSLKKFQERARLIHSRGTPYLRESITLPEAERELFFDIEVDPMRDVCYLHGFVERERAGDGWGAEIYVGFFINVVSAEEEMRVFQEAWQYIQDRQPCSIYYYSSYERTWWRKLQEKYPSVCETEELEALFKHPQTIDLYTSVVSKVTEWPTKDHSIKTLASYLGFIWRDTEPSGAASIQWFHQWTEEGDEDLRRRILEYNEDDCVATRVLLEGVRGLRTS